MNCERARSKRASGPLLTTNRAPEIFVAVSKSIRPSASPMSKCSFGAKSTARGSPTRRNSTLSFSSRPSGTSSSGVLGISASALSSAKIASRSSASNSASAVFKSPTSIFKALARSASPAFIAAPISFDAALRRSCVACALVIALRRRSSSARSFSASGSRPLLLRPRSKTFAFSRIHLMSYMRRVPKAEPKYYGPCPAGFA